MANQQLVNQPAPDATLAKLAKSKNDVRSLLQGPEFHAAVAQSLPRAFRPDRFVRVALSAVLRQPELLECARESLFQAFLSLSQYGIEPDGRRAHLIPFYNNNFCTCNHHRDAHARGKCAECGCGRMQSRRDVQLIIDYKGLAELVRRSGDVSYIHADVVYENDEWDYTFGSGAFLKHKPNLADRGARQIAFYSFVRLKDESEDFMVMSLAEVEKIRQRSKAANNGPWKTDYDEMGKKTVFRRHSKWLPLSPEVRQAVEHDDDDTTIEASPSSTQAFTDAFASLPVSLDQFSPSQDPNRGHDEVAGKESPKTNGESGGGQISGSRTGEPEARTAQATTSASASDPSSASDFGNIDPPPEVDELPDIADAKQGEMIRFHGANYRFSEEANAWALIDVQPQTTAQKKPESRKSGKGGGFNF